jgi:hypothetical protein
MHAGWNNLPHATGDDTRHHVFTFRYGDEAYGLYMFSIAHWIELIFMMLVETGLAAVTARIVYYAVVESRLKNDGSDSGRSLSLPKAAVLVSLLPMWIFGPRYALNAFGIDNKIFRFCLGVSKLIFNLLRWSLCEHGS